MVEHTFISRLCQPVIQATITNVQFIDFLRVSCTPVQSVPPSNYVIAFHRSRPLRLNFLYRDWKGGNTRRRRCPQTSARFAHGGRRTGKSREAFKIH